MTEELTRAAEQHALKVASKAWHNLHEDVQSAMGWKMFYATFMHGYKTRAGEDK